MQYLQKEKSNFKFNYRKQDNSLVIESADVFSLYMDNLNQSNDLDYQRNSQYFSEMDDLLRKKFSYADVISHQGQSIVVEYDLFLRAIKRMKYIQYTQSLTPIFDKLKEEKFEVSPERHRLLAKNFLYAEEILSILKFFHPFEKPRIEMEKMLSQHPEYALDLVKGIKDFNRNILPQDAYALILAVKLTSGYAYLSAIAYGKAIFAEDPLHAVHTIKKVKELLRSSVPQYSKDPHMKDYVEILDECADLLDKKESISPHVFSIAAGRVKLKKAGWWFAHQQQNILARYPEHAMTLASGMVYLNENKFFSPENLDFLTLSAGFAQHALDIAHLLVEWDKLKLLNADTRQHLKKLITEKPECAKTLYLAAIDFQHIENLPSKIQFQAKDFFSRHPEQGANVIAALKLISSFLRASPVDCSSQVDTLFKIFMKYSDRASHFAQAFIYLTERFPLPMCCKMLVDYSEHIEQVATALQFLQGEWLQALRVLLFTDAFNLKYAAPMAAAFVACLNASNLGTPRAIEDLRSLITQHSANIRGIVVGAIKLCQFNFGADTHSVLRQNIEYLAPFGKYAEDVAIGMCQFHKLNIASASNVKLLIEYKMYIPEILTQLADVQPSPEINWQNEFSKIIKKLRIPFLKGDDSKNEASISSAFFRSPLYDKNLLPMIFDLAFPALAPPVQKFLKK